MYPRVIINKEKFRHNVRYLLDTCHDHGLLMMAVTKVFCADQNLVDILIEENVDYIADSRIQNLQNISSAIPKVLLRIPMISEAEAVVRHSDISLNSEIDTIKELDRISKELKTYHKVILMIDLGDLREGIFDELEVFKTVEFILSLSYIKLEGIGVNLTCYGGVIPTVDTLNRLVNYKDNIERKYGITLNVLSGGNSSNMKLLLEGKLPKEINNIRIGEAAVLGRETAFGNTLDSMYTDVFTLSAEVVELKKKPSVPIGPIGMNAFGKIPTFKDKGYQKRAIIAIGKQDVDCTELIPTDTIEVLGASSDHIILDVSNASKNYKIGDTISFRLTYGSILSLMTSKYVKKYYE